MSVHNTEVHRCRECLEIVIVKPEGFSLSMEEIETKALAHREQCHVVLERMLQDD